MTINARSTDTIHVSLLQRVALGAGLLASFVLPGTALACAAAWLAIRVLSYLRSDTVRAEITGWQRDLDHKRPEEVLARPILSFTERSGRVRTFTSSRTYHDAPAPDGGELPSGELAVRYRPMPFFAELDDPRLWFTLPALMCVISILGLLLNFFFRVPVLRLLGY